MSNLFIDNDGVLGDFDTFFFQITGIPSRQFEQKHGPAQFWRVIESYRDADGRGFFECLPLMAGALELMAALQHRNPIILTGAPAGSWARTQKINWGKQHFPNIDMIVCLSKDKKLHMLPGDVIIDDWEQHMSKWVDAGGHWITHISAEKSIAAVKALHPEWFS